jgi:hypothetical protein
MTKSSLLAEAVKSSALDADKRKKLRRMFNGYVAGDLLPISEILAALPKHKQYVELLPGMPLFAAKSSVAVEIVNDRFKHVVSLFRVLRTPKLLRRFCQVQATLDDMEFDEWRLLGAFINHERSKFWQACAYYHLLRQLFLRGRTTQASLWGASYDRNYRVFNNRWSKVLYKWMSEIDEILPDLHGRLMRVQYEYNSWHHMLELYDDPNTLFWIDGRADIINACAKEDLSFTKMLKQVKGHFALLFWGTDLPKTLRKWDIVKLPGESCLVIKE